MKQELSKVPLMGWGCKQIGHIFIDRSNTKRAIASLHKAKSLLQRGISVVFFPEGQRSRNGRLQEFKKGGFILAQEIKLPILPVSISGSYRILPSKTYKLLPGHISICIHAPINTTAYSSQELTRIMFETRKRIADGLMD
jgi:1-acyl-sn-glycerol-3-phosphate acyltransferase